jgi:beta-lactamase superfamily II metal-dependent hydrolase
MKVRIKVLDVGDADAIIVTLNANERSLVVLIDGGRVKHKNKVIGKLNEQLKRLNKKVPDLIICTHYDADHIAGLIKIVNYYKRDISSTELWIFDTSSFKELITAKKVTEKSSIRPSIHDTYVNSVYQSNSGMDATQAALVKTLQQEQELITMAEKLGMTWKQPLAGKCELTEWGIKVIGPTSSYFYDLFPKALKEQSAEPEEVRSEELKSDDDFCKSFNLTSSPISKPNLGSAVILITVGETKFLFGGDAGIDSFYNIQQYTEVLENVDWFKVPHHGSRNNLNNDLIDLIKPKVAVISGSGHADNNLIKCMRSKGIEVYVTRDDKDLCFDNGIYQPCV